MEGEPWPRLSTGVEGLDDVLGGGLPEGALYLIEGSPGAGKTTLAIQMAASACARGISTLYLTLSESAAEIHNTAQAHGLDLGNLQLRELLPSDDAPSTRSSIFHPAELELSQMVGSIVDLVREYEPKLLIFDSLAEIRLLAESPLRYKRQILQLKHFFQGLGCTVLLLDDRGPLMPEVDLHSIAHGVLSLEQLAPEYGAERRRMRVIKLRASSYRGGYHDFRIRQGGLTVYPRLVAAETRQGLSKGTLISGVSNLDMLTGGGLDRGNSTLIVGPAGAGKSSLAVAYAHAAAERGEHAALFVFEESEHTLLERSAGLGLALEGHIEAGRITLRQVDPAELSPGEFAGIVRTCTMNDPKLSLVVIDSLNGYFNAMPDERFLALHLHELLSYLRQHNIATLMVAAQLGIVGSTMRTPVEASYIADAVILLRYFEFQGSMRQAISVVKKRTGHHERIIREFSLDDEGLHVGDTLDDFEGILSGVPRFVGTETSLMGLDVEPT